MEEALGQRIKSARLREGLTQAALAEKVGVAQAAVSFWEAGHARPELATLQKLEQVLGPLMPEPAPTKSEEIPAPSMKPVPAEVTEQLEGAAPDSVGEISAYGAWLRGARQTAKMTVAELAKVSGVSLAQVHNIETGRSQNPIASTRQKLEAALKSGPPEDVVKDTSDPQQIIGLGELIDFDPHDRQNWPACAGVYVLYDISQRPIYVGKAGGEIAARLGHHFDRFWFRSPIVQYASYIEVADETLRHQLEQVLIKFLKSNAVINKQSKESFEPE